jgi:hypothetical protein
MKIREALENGNVSYRDFYSALQDADIGAWDDINSTDIIHDYLNDMIQQGVRVSHIVEALENNDSEYDDWCIWLGNSMETPNPINSKQDLIDALQLDEEDLNMDIKFKN